MGLERRIRAAQVLGGFKSLDDLAAAIGREDSGLSRKTLRRIASDSDPRQAKDYELGWIAEACGVPLSFLMEGVADPANHLGEIAGLIDRNAEMLREAIAQAAEERRQIRDLLATQAEILREIRRVVAGMPEDETLRLWDQAVRQLAEAQERAEGDRDGGEEHAGPSAAQA
jgi:transcriptional regulator with XRE-family HTH domain